MIIGALSGLALGSGLVMLSNLNSRSAGGQAAKIIGMVTFVTAIGALIGMAF